MGPFNENWTGIELWIGMFQVWTQYFEEVLCVVRVWGAGVTIEYQIITQKSALKKAEIPSRVLIWRHGQNARFSQNCYVCGHAISVQCSQDKKWRLNINQHYQGPHQWDQGCLQINCLRCYNGRKTRFFAQDDFCHSQCVWQYIPTAAFWWQKLTWFVFRGPDNSSKKFNIVHTA